MAAGSRLRYTVTETSVISAPYTDQHEGHAATATRHAVTTVTLAGAKGFRPPVPAAEFVEEKKKRAIVLKGMREHALEVEYVGLERPGGVLVFVLIGIRRANN